MLSTDEYGRLIGQLRTWCKASHGRQKELATRLEVSPQLVSDWLSGHRTVSLDEWTQIQPIIQSAGSQFPKDNPMSTPVFEPKADRPSRSGPNEPKTLHDAKEMIGELRAELASAKAAPIVAPPVKLPPAPSVKPPAAPALPPTTLNTERAKGKLANATVEDLRAGLKEARAQGNLEAVNVIMGELQSRVVSNSSNDRSGISAPVALPVEANSPAGIKKVFDETSTAGLREMINSEKSPERRMLIYREIQAREKSLK